MTRIWRSVVRRYGTAKRFYESVGVVGGDGHYEVALDRRKLKTPAGGNFRVESEPLALAVASEWDAQRGTIRREAMHLTALCSTVLDNPNQFSKFDIVNYLADYLQTDTILFQSHENDRLYELQQKEWDPIIQWFRDRFDVDVKKVRGIEAPIVNSDVKAAISKYFLSHDFATVNGFVYGTDTLKSIILMLAAVERLVTPEKAVYLARLEEEYQCEYWGRVEWSHDLQQQDLQSRLSAALLFVYFNSSGYGQRSKTVQ